MQMTLVILGIGFVVWLVSTLYKNAEEARKRVEQERTPRRPSAATEIDRFLEEIQRRRAQQQSATRPVPAQLVEKPRPVQPLVIDRPRTAQKPPIQARPVSPRPVPVRPVPARPVESPRPSLAGPITAVLVEEPTFGPPPMEAIVVADFGSAPASRQRVSARPAPTSLADLIKTLHSKKGVKQALLAGIILGAPRCKQDSRSGRWC